MVEALAGVNLPTAEPAYRGGTREEDEGRKVRADRQGERADGVVVRSPVDKAADRRGDAQRDHFLRLILRGAKRFGPVKAGSAEGKAEGNRGEAVAPAETVIPIRVGDVSLIV